MEIPEQNVAFPKGLNGVKFRVKLSLKNRHFSDADGDLGDGLLVTWIVFVLYHKETKNRTSSMCRSSNRSQVRTGQNMRTIRAYREYY